MDYILKELFHQETFDCLETQYKKEMYFLFLIIFKRDCVFYIVMSLIKCGHLYSFIDFCSISWQLATAVHVYGGE